MNRRLGLFLTACLLACLSVAQAESRVLDDFEGIDGWKVFPSQGARGALACVEGETGRALALAFDLRGTHGHVIARKDFMIELPENYQFSFDLRADAPVNNFEVKLIDSDDNVWWLKRLDLSFPTEWTTQHLRKRHLSFAWGPCPKPAIRHVKALEFVVSAGSGGVGRVMIDNLRFEPIDDDLARKAQGAFSQSPRAGKTLPELSQQGTVLTHWVGLGAKSWLEIDFGYERELGGLVLDWEPGRHASAYAVQLSADGTKWKTVHTVTQGNGGRDYLYLPEQQGRRLRLVTMLDDESSSCELARLEVKDPGFGSSENAFFQAIAKDQPRGTYPRYLVPEQVYWTLMGSPADASEALLSEHGTIEVDQLCHSLEPFLYIDGKLITWADVGTKQSLEKGYLPIPSVEWRRGGLTLTVTAFAAGKAGPDSSLIVRYKLRNEGAPIKGRLFLAIRPFQVNPPWQSLFHPAGWARVNRIRMQDGIVQVNERPLILLDRPSGFGATPFEAGDITEKLLLGQLPDAQEARDGQGFASAAMAYDFELGLDESREIHILSPFHEGGAHPKPNLSSMDASRFYEQAHAETRLVWESMLDRFQVKLSPAAQPVIDTIKSNLAYIFINQDGPRIQPGSRNYQRSWIRDGSLTSTALLELGLKEEVRAFADWYTPFQFPDGKVPCVVDERGGDATNEHDSHGQLIYLIMQVYHYTHDRAWLRGKWPAVQKAVGYIKGLRAQRKTESYRSGTAEQRVLYGLVPESISHEGYSSKPMHSYWDNFFVLRGLKDAVEIAGILNEVESAAAFAAERDECAKDLYASIRLAMENRNIDYIPGCAELGDFDATSTTIALCPVNELGRIPEIPLHRTFDRYYESFVQRRDDKREWLDFTPYENRVIGSFVVLGQKERVKAALDFFMAQRRPAAWNHWAEVVYHDLRTPRMIGDMPHTWCGSDFIRSVRSMFVYENEQDKALILAAGVPEEWVRDPAGIEVSRMPTWYGTLDYAIRCISAPNQKAKVAVTVAGNLEMPPGGIVMPSPLNAPIKAVSGDGRLISPETNEIWISRLPASLTIAY